LTNDHWRVNGGNRTSNAMGKVMSLSVVNWGLYRRRICRIINLLPIREQPSQHTMERLGFFRPAEFFAPDRHGFGASTEASGENEKQFIWQEELSENAQKLYVQILGDTCTPDYLQFLEAEHGIDVQAGLEELDRHSQVDYSDSHIIRLKWVVEAGI
jgi:hypothetical protein